MVVVLQATLINVQMWWHTHPCQKFLELVCLGKQCATRTEFHSTLCILPQPPFITHFLIWSEHIPISLLLRKIGSLEPFILGKMSLQLHTRKIYPSALPMTSQRSTSRLALPMLYATAVAHLNCQTVMSVMSSKLLAKTAVNPIQRFNL